MNRTTHHIVLFLLFGCVSYACIDPVNLNLEAEKSHLVVFGWVTDEPIAYEVKLSKSNGFSDKTEYQAVPNAEVFVTDQLSNRYDFAEVASTGRYLSDPSNFVGIPEYTYQLTIIHEGNTYQSSREQMPKLPPVEDASISFISDPLRFEIKPNDNNFFISAFIDDDPGVDNYYRWKVFVNGRLRNSPEELILFNDRFTNGNRFKFDAGNVLFTQSDNPHFQHRSLSQKAYEYYVDMKEQTSNSTLSPRIQPGIIRGNIMLQNNPDELVLGYFGASQVVTIKVGE